VSNRQKKLRNNSLVFTQISDDQFLIEGKYETLKISGENEYSITCVKINNSIALHIGHKFLGYGKITRIEIIENTIDSYIIIKTTIIGDEE